jgi:hypothetical protein
MHRSERDRHIQCLDVSHMPYPERLCAAALQGLVNRDGPLIYLDYGIYDDPSARRTNEVFLDDEIWYGKYRRLLGDQDEHNLEYYREAHGFQVETAGSLGDVIRQHRDALRGCVIWDAALPDTANIALMLAARQSLLVLEAGMRAWAAELDLPIQHDLCGKWRDRLSLYEWAYRNLFGDSKEGVIACVEPGWGRSEFVDYLIQQKIFTYSLGSRSGGIGDKLLLLLAFGPPWLRELLFATRLDGWLRPLALVLMGRRSPEVRLGTRLQRDVKARPYPTIFGWHTQRDDELAFMLQLSANGLRLVPSHLAGNMSFHSQVKPLGSFKAEEPEEEPALDPQGIYVTFTLSDGDQLMMMCTGEMGNWYSPKRGSLPFNWETQPLLSELAPALLDKYIRSATSNDCLVAGPSGAGYIIPPLAPNLPAYLQESRRICLQAGIQCASFYVADPPRRVLRELGRYSDGMTGYVAGYAVMERSPQSRVGDAMFVANQWPTLPHLWDSAEDLLGGVRKLVDAPGPGPRFIGVHLFAYRTTLEDVIKFAQSLDQEHVHIVRADTFLRLAYKHHQHSNSGA